MKILSLTLMTMSILVTSFETRSSTRPSVSGNASRISILENGQLSLRNDVDVNTGDIDNLQQQIDENRLAIEGFEAQPGPQGPTGAPGPLSDLSCESGQVAMWDGNGWACGSIGTVSSVSDDDCIRGFPFSYQLTSDGQSPDAWTVLCETVEESSTRIDIGGSFLLSAERDASNDNISLSDETEFSRNLVEIDIAPVNTEESPRRNDGGIILEVTLTALTPEQGSGIKDWATTNIGGSSTNDKSLIMNFSGNLFELHLNNCLPTAFFNKPVLTGESRGQAIFHIQETVNLRCGALQGVNFENYPDLTNKLTELISDFEPPRAGPLTISFTNPPEGDLSEFNRTYQNTRLSGYQFPRFSRSVIEDRTDGASSTAWLIGSHGATFRSTPERPL